MDGLLLVNKPVGITSFDVIRRLRRITEISKIGHAGTLDPAAEGLMLILFGTGCKQASRFSKMDKTYLAKAELGYTSSTGDREGELTKGTEKVPDKTEVLKVLEGFVGDIRQVPPVYSAVKVRGQEAYKRARRGEVVVLPERVVTVRALTLVKYGYPELVLEASVSSGTYIRSLAEDIGSFLGTGGYLKALRRTKVGQFDLSESVELAGLSEAEVARQMKRIDNLQ